MLGTVTKNNNQFLLIACILFGCLFLNNIVTLTASALTSNAGTMVGATLCTTTSTVSLIAPVSDSVVTNPTVPLSGTVTQASQIEVYIDDIFDSVIPLSMGQTSFSGSVQLASGTHTIKVVAINTCPGSNGSDSAVVTYQPPPNEESSGSGSSGTTSSSGAQTPTRVGGVQIGGEPLSESTTPSKAESTSPLKAFEPILEWLNIKTIDTMGTHQLSLWQAAVIAVGLYLLIVGMAVAVLKRIAAISLVAAMLPTQDAKIHVRWLSWAFRLLGLLLLLAVLFMF
jgi:hypothetical protein